MDATSISDIKSANAWQAQTALYLAWLQGGMQGDAVSIITPYITELTICDGITNVGNFAMAGARSLVTHDIPDSEIHVGLPAKFLRRIMED